MSPPQERIPFRGPIRVSDVAASVSDVGPRYARRFSLDIAEDALQRMGAAAVPHIAERIAERVAYEHQQLIEEAVLSYLHDRTWAEPIIREAITRTVHDYIWSMLRGPRPRGGA